jgi:hypothetical protein
MGVARDRLLNELERPQNLAAVEFLQFPQAPILDLDAIGHSELQLFHRPVDGGRGPTPPLQRDLVVVQRNEILLERLVDEVALLAAGLRSQMLQAVGKGASAAPLFQ